jgi:hypothetical protein
MYLFVYIEVEWFYFSFKAFSIYMCSKYRPCAVQYLMSWHTASLENMKYEDNLSVVILIRILFTLQEGGQKRLCMVTSGFVICCRGHVLPWRHENTCPTWYFKAKRIALRFYWLAMSGQFPRGRDHVFLHLLTVTCMRRLIYERCKCT